MIRSPKGRRALREVRLFPLIELRNPRSPAESQVLKLRRLVKKGLKPSDAEWRTMLCLVRQDESHRRDVDDELSRWKKFAQTFQELFLPQESR